jgi:hypothetical protein
MNPIEQIRLTRDFIRYNVKIIFANKFIYFLIAAFAFYFTILAISLFTDTSPENADIYYSLIFPGILILFYPIIFNIQSDKDTRMLEIIFAVPNYRYKVYLVRFGLSILLLISSLLVLAWVTEITVIHIPVAKMIYQLMYCLLFLASLSLLLTSLLKNANAAAVIMVLIGLVFFILGANIEASKWNLFLNPFDVPANISFTIWQNVLFQNRMMLVVGTIICILWALINLQKREKLV